MPWEQAPQKAIGTVSSIQRRIHSNANLHGALAAVNLVNDVMGALAINSAADRLGSAEDFLSWNTEHN